MARKKLDNSESMRKFLEFVTAVYHSSRGEKNINLPIKKENPLY